MLSTVLIICLIVACIGIGLVTGLFSKSTFDEVKRRYTEIRNMDAKTADNTKSLSETVQFYSGKKRIITRETDEAKSILLETGRASELGRVIIKSVLFMIIGVLIGFICGRNYLLMIIFGIGGLMIPLWQLKLYRNKYRKYMNSQLESTVSMITTSYIRCADITASVEENMEQISPILKPVFRDFVSETKINPNTKNCVRNMKEKINNSIFHEWCDTLIRTLDNTEMREALLPVVTKYTEVSVVQDEIDVETRQALIEYIIMMIMDVLCYPMVYLLNKEWFASYRTLPGKIVVAITFAVILYSLVKMIAIMQPVEYDR